MRHLYHALLLLPLSFAAAAADSGTELENLYSALNMLNQQQQAVYQQFQMVQELRRSAPALYGIPMRPQPGGPVANYDAVVEAQNHAIRREESLSLRADQLLDSFSEIEALKKPLQSRIYALSLKDGQD